MKICITDARMRLGDLIRRAQAGEDVILTRGRVAVARLVPLDPPAKDGDIAGGGKTVSAWDTRRGVSLAGSRFGNLYRHAPRWHRSASDTLTSAGIILICAAGSPRHGRFAHL